MSDMETRIVRLNLPVTISREAQRQALLETGHEPEPEQIYRVNDLAHVDPEARRRLVEIRDRCDFDSGASYIDPEFGMEVEGDDWQVTSFEWVHRNRDDNEVTIYQPDGAPPGEEPPSVTASHILFPGEDGRTRNLVERALELSDAPDVLEAALGGAPLVTELENNVLSLDVVLDAYERAGEAVCALTILVDQGENASDSDIWWNGIAQHDNTILITAGRNGGRTVGLHRGSDPKAFDNINPLIDRVDRAFHPGVEEFRDCVTHHAGNREWGRMTDAERIRQWIRPYAEGAERKAVEEAAKTEARKAYEADREQWISKHGCTRLQKAAERGYKHDRLYRDERLAAELPGFVAAKVKKTGEPLAPTEDALDLEEEIRALIAGTSMKCTLVWVTFEDDHVDGVYVQVEGFLGHHTVYRDPDDEHDPDREIPF